VATELRPGLPGAIFARLGEEGQARGRLALEPLALAIERQAKVNLSGASHKYGTPTTAVPGTGPAIISGNLRRSITHTRVVSTSLGWTVRIGTGVGFYPTYRTARGRVLKGKTPANVYGEILEVHGSRAGRRFPFLGPAFKFGVTYVAPTLFRRAYGASWRQLI
jgi:hypothetical protein